jgi:putative transposase
MCRDHCLRALHGDFVQTDILDGKGRALDNIFTERLWRTVKYENIYLQDYQFPREARQGIRDYLTYYNQ